MKKLISIILAIFMVAGLTIGMQASAVKNLLTVTEETSEIYPGTHISDMLEPNHAFMGSWSNLPGAADGNYIEKGIVGKDKNTKKLGNYSLKITNGKLGCSTVNVLVKGLPKNTTYTLQAWIKTDKVLSIDSGAMLDAAFYQPKHTPLPTSTTAESERFTGTKDWKRISLTFKTPNQDFSDALFGFKLWGSTGTVWYDGIALTEGKAVVDDSKLENPVPIATSTPKPTATSTPKPTATPVDKPSSWAKAEVDEAIAAKLVPAALQSKYTSSITRSDFCDLVVNMIEVKSGKKIADFVKEKVGKDLSDKPFPDTASVNVNAANKLGIVNGRTNGNFDPSGLITRQEAAKMLALTAKALGADITASAAKFTDDAKIATWAKEFVNFVFAKSVMAGTGNNNFSPAANYTREQSFLTILRLYKALS